MGKAAEPEFPVIDRSAEKLAGMPLLVLSFIILSGVVLMIKAIMRFI
jgi:hypothetical protein